MYRMTVDIYKIIDNSLKDEVINTVIVDKASLSELNVTLGQIEHSANYIGFYARFVSIVWIVE